MEIPRWLRTRRIDEQTQENIYEAGIWTLMALLSFLLWWPLIVYSVRYWMH